MRREIKDLKIFCSLPNTYLHIEDKEGRERDLEDLGQDNWENTPLLNMKTPGWEEDSNNKSEH